MNLGGLVGALLPVFLLALGYIAVKRNVFDADQTVGSSNDPKYQRKDLVTSNALTPGESQLWMREPGGWLLSSEVLPPLQDQPHAELQQLVCV